MGAIRIALAHQIEDVQITLSEYMVKKDGLLDMGSKRDLNRKEVGRFKNTMGLITSGEDFAGHRTMSFAILLLFQPLRLFSESFY